MTSAICVVPARAGSVGVPGKNLERIEGVSLVARSFLHAQIMNPAGPVLVTTDSQDVVNDIANAAGCPAPRLEAFEPGTVLENSHFLLHRRLPNHASSTARIGEVLKSIRATLRTLDQSFDAWVLLQPTSPFRSAKELGTLRLKLAESNRETSIVSVREVDDLHPARMYTMSGNNNLISLGFGDGLEMANRQELPKVYIRDGGFYVIGDSLIAKGKQFSGQPVGVLRGFPWTLNIDKPEDLILARAIGRVEGEGILLGG